MLLTMNQLQRQYGAAVENYVSQFSVCERGGQKMYDENDICARLVRMNYFKRQQAQETGPAKLPEVSSAARILPAEIAGRLGLSAAAKVQALGIAPDSDGRYGVDSLRRVLYQRTGVIYRDQLKLREQAKHREEMEKAGWVEARLPGRAQG